MGGLKAKRQRGTTESLQRDALCKDCSRREGGEANARFSYDEQSALQTIDRGGSRSDRCPECRRHHRTATSGLEVAYIDLETLGEVRDRDNPTGPLGGLGPLPDRHEPRLEKVDLQDFQFGMTDADAMETLGHLASKKQVLVLEAGTGTGKSTLAPFRMMEPPPGAPIRLCDRGPIIVTEPRRQAATGVARFVAEKLCGTPVGPGFRVGYQVAGDKQHDPSCQLVYVTDGTFINWLGDGTLAHISTVVIDEAHERSENIDFILGMLRHELPKHPHLRVVIASATINSREFIEYFGGDEEVAHQEVEAVKSFGYGKPLFARAEIPDLEKWIAEHWPERYGPPEKDREPEDLRATTRALHELRFEGTVGDDWKSAMPVAIADQVLKLAREAPPGDILVFLPTRAQIEAAMGRITAGLDDDKTVVYELLASTPTAIKELALAPGGENRKIVVSSNLAETSLTVEGVRYIVDSGLIAQSEWDPEIAQSSVPTRRHSRAGLMQRWGRAGRSAPGWVFPMYSEEELHGGDFPESTAPGSARASSESLLLKAKARGIDEPRDLVWPTSFEHPRIKRDEEGQRAARNFVREMERGSNVIHENGSVDDDGHLTLMGREAERFPGSPATSMAVAMADQLTCVPEVVMGLAALDGQRLLGPAGLLHYDKSWPAAWRVEAAERHRALATGCRDDLQLAIRALALAQRDGAGTARWWLNSEVVEGIVTKTETTLGALSPMMKESATRPLDMRLVERARAVITRAFGSTRYQRVDDETFRSVSQPDTDILGVVDSAELISAPDTFLALGIYRPEESDRAYLSNLIEPTEWAIGTSLEPLELLDAVARCKDEHRESGERENAMVDLMARLPVGTRLKVPKQAGKPLRLICTPWEKPVDDAAEEDPSEADTDFDPNASGGPLPSEAEHRTTVQDPRDAETNDEPGTATELAEEVEPLEFEADPGDVDESDIEVLSGVRGESIRINGYTLDPTPVARFEKDWRDEKDQGDPGRHQGVSWGETIDLIVGGPVEDHSSTLTTLAREDRGGRFLLGPHDRKSKNYQRGRVPPVALEPRDRSLPERIGQGTKVTATVLPGANGIPEVCLLRFLLRTLEKSDTRELARQPGAKREPFWPAVACSHSNDAGYAQFEIAGPQLTQRFGVKADDVKPGDELLISLAPTMPDEIALDIRSDEVGQFAQEHQGYMRVIERQGERRLVGTRRQLSLPDVRELAGLVDEEAWERQVYAWWAATSCRSAGATFGLDDAVAEAAEDRHVPVPEHLIAPLRGALKAEISSGFDDVEVAVRPAGEAVISGASAESVGAVSERLARLASAPAVQVNIVEKDAGRIIGKGGRNIKELGARPGILWVSLERSVLLIVGESAALLEAVSGISAALDGARAVLEIPADGHGRLVGAKHATRKRLLSESGCTDAHAIPGSNRWELRAPSTDQLEEFHGLASAIVSPCKLVEIEEQQTVVRDAHTQTVIGNWRDDLVDWRWPARDEGVS